MSGIVYVPGYGPRNPKLMIIGESPKCDEERDLLPFVGPCGQFLRESLREAGWDVEKEVYFTNAVKVRTYKNRKPTSKEIESWRLVLTGEIIQKLEAASMVVVCLGKVAKKAVPKELIDFFKMNVIYSNHPAYIEDCVGFFREVKLTYQAIP